MRKLAHLLIRIATHSPRSSTFKTSAAGDPTILRADAARKHQIYGSYGISVFALRDATIDELAQEPPLVRFATLTLMVAGDIRAAGLRLEATGRNPRHFSVAFDDPADGVARICDCDHRTIANPYHEA